MIFKYWDICRFLNIEIFLDIFNKLIMIDIFQQQNINLDKNKLKLTI